VIGQVRFRTIPAESAVSGRLTKRQGARVVLPTAPALTFAVFVMVLISTNRPALQLEHPLSVGKALDQPVDSVGVM
jgi:hypothetical protein